MDFSQTHTQLYMNIYKYMWDENGPHRNEMRMPKKQTRSFYRS